MHLSIKKIRTNIDLIIVDGNRFLKYKQIPHYCIIKGDSKFLNIAAVVRSKIPYTNIPKKNDSL